MRARTFTEKQIAQINKLSKEKLDARSQRRVNALKLRSEGLSLKEIQEVTGFSLVYTSSLIKAYIEEGADAVVKNKYGQHRRNLTYEQEEALLAPFHREAEKGEMISVKRIENAYIETVGHSIGVSQIKLVLHRHGWLRVGMEYQINARDGSYRTPTRLRNRSTMWVPGDVKAFEGMTEKLEN
ncbi:MAG: helix-turn-helix domain-containing protein [Clostridia bacterium]|nr:helix-turn-helix domain-containing protein [Clostridia bacterium]